MMTTASRWQIFSAAPHRLMFLAGAVQLVLALLWWSAELASRFTPLAPLPTPVIPAIWLHAWLMLYGIFPFFMFGFLMTTYPRWMNQGEVQREWYVPAFLLLAGGAALFYPAMYLGIGWLLGAVALSFIGWVVGTLALFRVYHAARGRDRFYETQLNLVLSLGALGILAQGMWLVSAIPWWLDISLNIGLWGYLVPLLIVVGHRMIPFFSSMVLKDYRPVQPRWILALLWVGVLGHGWAELAGDPSLRLLPDLVLLVTGLFLTTRWGLWRSLSIRLLAVLHVSFAWFSLGMFLFVVQDLGWLLFDVSILGRGPLHALGIGFIAAMVLGMATRVSRGHSGRPLVMDRLEWIAFLGLQLVAVLRVTAEFGFSPVLVGNEFMLIVAIAWLMFLSPWVIRFVPIFLKRRIDNKPG